MGEIEVVDENGSELVWGDESLMEIPKECIFQSERGGWLGLVVSW